MKLLNSISKKPANNYLILLLIILLAFIVRIYSINFEGLWTDELIAAYASNPYFSLRRMYNVLHFWDQTPPLYPLMLWCWLKISGFTEFNARLFSVIGGIFSLVAVYFLIKEIYNKKTALVILFLLSITPYHIYFSREVRSYIWSLFVTTIVLYFFVKQIENYNNKLNRLLFILSGGLLLHISYFSFFVHAGLVFCILLLYIKEKQNLKNWILDYFFIGIMFIPWLFQFIRVLGFHNGVNKSKPSVLYIFDILNVFSASNTAGYMLIVGYVILFLSVVYIYKNNFQKKTTIILFSCLFIVVYFIMYLKSITGRNILNGFGFSYVIVLLPVYLVIFGGIIMQVNKKTTILFVSFVVVVMMFNFDKWYTLSYFKKKSEPYRELAAYISSSP